MIPNFLRIDNQTYFADIQIGMNKVLIRYTYNISSEWEDLQQACNRMVRLLQAKWLIPRDENKIRSIRQNRLYRLWLGIIEKETWNDHNALHAMMKKKFLSKRKLVKLNGKRSYSNMEWSTTELSVKKFTEFLDKVHLFFSENGYYLPTEDKLDMDSLINTYWNR